MRKFLLSTLVLVIGLTIFAGFTVTGFAKAADYTIAFVPGITTDAFYISMKRGAQAAAEEFGVKLIWQGPAQWDYTKQVPIVETLLAKQPDFMVAAPCDTNALIEPLRKIHRAGIPIITVDTNIADESFLVANITSDNLQGGEAAARFLVDLSGGEGKVAVVNTMPGISTTDARQNGFLQEIEKHPGMEVVATEYCNDEQNRAAAITENIVLANPDLKGIFAANVVSAAGVIQGLKAKNKTGEIALVAYDAMEDEVIELREGSIQALVVQKPYQEGYLAVKYAVQYLNGNTDIEKHILLPAVIATQDNMNDPEVNQFFYK